MTVQPGQIKTSFIGGPGLIHVDSGSPVYVNVPYHGAVMAALNGATPITVVDANVTANSIILFTLKTVGGTVGAAPAIQTITPGTGFTVAGTASDTSIYNYVIMG